MAGSEAEERIRAAKEAALRLELPNARIIHELEVAGARLDLAAIDLDRIVLVEIKSERDVMARLPNQLKWALSVTWDVRVVVTARHANHLTECRLWHRMIDGQPRMNDRHIKGLERAQIFVEHESCINRLHLPEKTYGHRVTPEAVMNLMLVSEMKEMLRPFGAKSRWTGPDLVEFAREHLSGAAIRRMTCAALRTRHFARADAKIPTKWSPL